MNNLKKVRKARNVKQEELAQLLNVKDSTYSRYESGKTNITPDALVKVARFFDVCTDYLLGIIDEPISPKEYLKTKAMLQQIKKEDALSIEDKNKIRSFMQEIDKIINK